jgi:hypothetical protein
LVVNQRLLVLQNASGLHGVTAAAKADVLIMKFTY